MKSNRSDSESKCTPVIIGSMDDKASEKLDADEEIVIQRGDHYTDLLYKVEDAPPLHITLIFGIQIALMNISFCITVALIISGCFCGDDILTSKMISSTLFLSGVATVIQTLLGLRLPVFQGPNPTFIVPLLNMAVLPEWKCTKHANTTLVSEWSGNLTVAATMDDTALSPIDRMQLAEGSLVVASIVHLFLGGSGLMGRLMKYIGPLTISPTIVMIGVSLFKPALDLSESNWGVAAMTFVIFLLMTAYLGHLSLPIPGWTRQKGCHKTHYPVLQILAVLAALAGGWLLSFVLTVTGMITDDPTQVEYQARSDAKLHTIDQADWFYFPYPGQFGPPSFSLPLFTGMVVCVLMSIVESLGDYVAVSQICGTPYPPRHALNRGILVEGFSSIVSALFGVGHGTTSYSEMISIIGLTKVSSRRVFIMSGFIMILMGVFGKIGAILVCIPPPVLGGKMILALGTLIGMGLSALQCVDLTRSRNYVTVGMALFLAIAIPEWILSHTHKINTGVRELDNTLVALIGNPIFISCFVGFLFDNTLPGKRSQFLQQGVKVRSSYKEKNAYSVYDLPYLPRRWFTSSWVRFIPFLPSYTYDATSSKSTVYLRKRKHDDKLRSSSNTC